ncbi:hypothetical protein HY78_16520 [Rhizorhabdus wittichii DC-6]|nr:hypothetical protein HY78_16520 [Rhizorhabdus wittichii DC-6]
MRESERRDVLAAKWQSDEDCVSSHPNSATAQLPSIDIPNRNWPKWISAAVSILLLAVIGRQLGQLDRAALLASIPASPGFWVALLAYYLALPLSEWIIFRRLWGLPVEGFAALLRKLVSNEVLLGYSGELSFYAWARRRAGMSAAPFGAIKDVSILSALAGNIATLAMMALAWPFVAHLGNGIRLRDLALSIAAVLLTSIAIGLLKRRIFSLPGDQLRFVMGVHLARLAATTLLSGLVWHCALPAVPLTLWIVLAALQLLVTRLPFIPNKDLLFASAALLIAGPGSDIGRLLAIVASIILVIHLLVGLLLSAAELVREARE